jgi:O-antigen biosynthesis protein
MMVDARYYSHVREDLIRLIPKGTKKVLEVGCGAGMTGKALKERGVEEVVGVELQAEAGKNALEHYDNVIIGDVEQVKLPYENGYFDCALYGDVLEHLIDPWQLLREHNGLIKEKGAIICSIPNIRYFKVTRRLVGRGKWEYEDDGVLDRTHLRFFTWDSIEQMLTDAGFTATEIVRKPSCASWIKWINTISGNLFIDHLVRKYVVLALKERQPVSLGGPK